LDEKPDGSTPGTEDGLYTRATLPTDCCHLSDTAAPINGYHRCYTAVWEEYMVERTIGFDEDLLPAALNVLEVPHNPLEIAGRQGE